MENRFLIIFLLAATMMCSQEITFESQVNKISKKIEIITSQEKDSLKIKVININKRLENGEISKTKASLLKKEVASYHARKIEERVGEQEKLLQQLVQDKTNGKIASVSDIDTDKNTFTIGNKTFRFTLNKKNKNEKQREKSKKKKRNRKTTTQIVFAIGVNNVLINHNVNSLNNSDYKFWASHFYEVGWTWKTRLNKNPSQLYLKYGLSFLWNNLRLKENQYHVKNGDVTEIQKFSENLSESRLRHVQMIFPLHLEWDLSKNKVNSNETISDRTNKSFRFGVGGFAGFKLGTRQYLEFTNSERVEINEIQKDNFNMNIFNYGVSAYLGYKSTSFYVKYDLNPLFQKTTSRNISLGIRLDLD